MVAIAGPPGSGKSTLAEQLKAELLQMGHQPVVVPMDGFHLDNAILEQRGRLHRKGAPETFDATGFVHLIERLSAAGGKDDVVIPVFDRDRDIAIAGADVVTKQADIILCEGNYLLIDQSPWVQLHEMWDQSILLNPGMDVIEQRLVQRWLDHGVSQGNEFPGIQN